MQYSMSDLMARYGQPDLPTEKGPDNYDGDSPYAEGGGTERMVGSDTFEMGTVAGAEGKKHLGGIMEEGVSAREVAGEDRHGRPLVKYYDKHGEDISARMIREGAAMPGYTDERLYHDAAYLQSRTGNSPYADISEQERVRNAQLAQTQFLNGLDPYYNTNGTMGSSMRRGADNMQAGLYGFANAIGSATGFDAMTEWGEDGVYRNLMEAARNPATIPHYEDIDSWADFGTFLLESVGENLPQLGVDAAALVLGGVTGGASLGSIAARRSVAAFGKSAARKMGITKAAQIGIKRGFWKYGKGAAAGSMYAQLAGENQSSFIQDGVDAPMTAMLAAVPQAALEYAGISTALAGAAKTFGIAPKVIDNLAGRVAARVGVAFGTEGSTEVGQQIIQNVAKSIHDGSDPLSDENIHELKNAFVKGGLVGGAIATPSASVNALADGYQRHLKKQMEAIESGKELDIPAIDEQLNFDFTPGQQNAGDQKSFDFSAPITDLGGQGVLNLGQAPVIPGIGEEVSPDQQGFDFAFERPADEADGQMNMDFLNSPPESAPVAPEQQSFEYDRPRLDLEPTSEPAGPHQPEVAAQEAPEKPSKDQLSMFGPRGGVTRAARQPAAPEPAAPEPATTQEPAKDIAAQLSELDAGKKPAVYLAKVNKAERDALKGKGYLIRKSPGQGWLVAKDQAVIDQYKTDLKTMSADEANQRALGYSHNKQQVMDAAAQGDAPVVVAAQKGGAVVHEEVAPASQAPAVAEQLGFQFPEADVQVITPEAVQQRRAEERAVESNQSLQDVYGDPPKAPVAQNQAPKYDPQSHDWSGLTEQDRDNLNLAYGDKLPGMLSKHTPQELAPLAKERADVIREAQRRSADAIRDDAGDDHQTGSTEPDLQDAGGAGTDAGRVHGVVGDERETGNGQAEVAARTRFLRESYGREISDDVLASYKASIERGSAEDGRIALEVLATETGLGVSFDDALRYVLEGMAIKAIDSVIEQGRVVAEVDSEVEDSTGPDYDDDVETDSGDLQSSMGQRMEDAGMQVVGESETSPDLDEDITPTLAKELSRKTSYYEKDFDLLKAWMDERHPTYGYELVDTGAEPRVRGNRRYHEKRMVTKRKTFPTLRAALAFAKELNDSKRYRDSQFHPVRRDGVFIVKHEATPSAVRRSVDNVQLDVIDMLKKAEGNATAEENSQKARQKNQPAGAPLAPSRNIIRVMVTSSNNGDQVGKHKALHAPTLTEGGRNMLKLAGNYSQAERNLMGFLASIQTIVDQGFMPVDLYDADGNINTDLVVNPTSTGETLGQLIEMVNGSRKPELTDHLARIRQGQRRNADAYLDKHRPDVIHTRERLRRALAKFKADNLPIPAYLKAQLNGLRRQIAEITGQRFWKNAEVSSLEAVRDQQIIFDPREDIEQYRGVETAEHQAEQAQKKYAKQIRTHDEVTGESTVPPVRVRGAQTPVTDNLLNEENAKESARTQKRGQDLNWQMINDAHDNNDGNVKVLGNVSKTESGLAALALKTLGMSDNRVLISDDWDSIEPYVQGATQPKGAGRVFYDSKRGFTVVYLRPRVKGSGDKGAINRAHVLTHELAHVFINDYLRSLNPEQKKRLRAAFDAEFQANRQKAWESKGGEIEWLADKIAADVIKMIRDKQVSEQRGLVGRILNGVRAQLTRMFNKAAEYLHSRFKPNATVSEVLQELLDSGAKRAPAQDHFEAAFGGSAATASAFARTPMAQQVHDQVRGMAARLKVGNLFHPNEGILGRLTTGDGQLRHLSTKLADLFFRGTGADKRDGDGWFNRRSKDRAIWEAQAQDLMHEFGVKEPGIKDMLKAFKDKKLPELQNAERFNRAWSELEAAGENADLSQLSADAKKIRKFLDTFYKRYARAAMPTLGFIPNYVPYFYSAPNIEQRKTDFVDVLRRHGFSATEANALAETLIDNAGNIEQDFGELGETTSPSLQHRKARKLRDAQLHRELMDAGFVVDNGAEVLSQYIHAMTGRGSFERSMGGYAPMRKWTPVDESLPESVKAAQDATNAKNLLQLLADRFGHTLEGDSTGAQAFRMAQRLGIQLTGRNAMEQVINLGVQTGHVQMRDGVPQIYSPNNKLISELDSLRGSDKVRAKEIIRGYTGRMQKEMPNAPRKWQSRVMAYMSYLTLAFSTLASIPDFATILIRARTAGGWPAVKAMSQAVQNYSDAKERARMLGMINSRMSQIALQEAYGISFADPLSKNATDMLFKLNGQEAFTNFTRVLSSAVAESVLKANLDRVRAGGKKGEIAQKELDSLGIDADSLQRWFNDGAQVWSPDMRGQKSKDARLVTDAIQQFTDEAVLRPNAAQRPVWANNPWFGLLWQLKSFSYAYGKVVTEGIWREMQKQYGVAEGDKAKKLAAGSLPLVYSALVMAPFAALTLALREGVTREEEDRPKRDEFDYALELLSRSGMAGPVELALGTLGRWDQQGVGALSPAFSHAANMWEADGLAERVTRSTPLLSQMPRWWDDVEDTLN